MAQIRFCMEIEGLNIVHYESSLCIRTCRVRFGLLVAGALLVAGGMLVPRQGAAESEDPVVARVNGEDILQSELLEVLSRVPSDVQKAEKETIKNTVLNQIISRRLVDADLKAVSGDGLASDPEVVELVSLYRRQAVRQIFVDRKLDSAVSGKKLAEAYRDFLEDNPPQLLTRARHILVDDRKTADELIGKVQAGEDFVDLAREHSRDPGSAPNGGDLGFFAKGRMVGPFAEAAFALPVGGFTETPVETEFGWHIILVEGRQRQQIPTFEELSDSLERNLRLRAFEEYLEGLHEKADIDILLP